MQTQQLKTLIVHHHLQEPTNNELQYHCHFHPQELYEICKRQNMQLRTQRDSH